MGKRYLDTKKASLESSILNVWQEAAVKQEKLSAKQKKLDVDGDGEIEGSDLAKLRKKGAKKEGLESAPNKANSQHLCAKNVVHEEWVKVSLFMVCTLSQMKKAILHGMM